MVNRRPGSEAEAAVRLGFFVLRIRGAPDGLAIWIVNRVTKLTWVQYFCPCRLYEPGAILVFESGQLG